MLMQIDGTFIFVVISFLIFLFIIKAILFNPMTKIMDERNSFYSKNEKMKNESKEKTKNLLKEKEETLSKTKEEASAILKTTLEKAKQEKEEEIKKAKQFVKDETQKQKDELILENKKAKEELKNEMSFFVSSIVSKVLAQETNIILNDEEIKTHLNI